MMNISTRIKIFICVTSILLYNSFVLPTYAEDQSLILNEIDSMKQRIYEITTELLEIHELVEFQPFTALWLNEFFKISSKNLLLESLQQTEFQIVIQGIALPELQLDTYERHLEESPYFKTIVVRETDMTSVGKNILIRGKLEYTPPVSQNYHTTFQHYTSSPLTYYNKVKKQLQQVEIQLKEVSRKLVGVRSLPVVIDQVYQLVIEARLTPLLFEPIKPIDHSSPIVPIILEVSGTYHNFIIFVNAVSHMEYLVIVDNVTMLFHYGELGKISCQIFIYKKLSKIAGDISTNHNEYWRSDSRRYATNRGNDRQRIEI